MIFLTITALPESDAQTSFVLKAFLPSKTRRMASATAPASMIAPSTIESGGTGSLTERHDAVSLARGLQLDRLDGARPDVESDDVFWLSKHAPLAAEAAGTGATQLGRGSTDNRAKNRQEPDRNR